MNPIRRIKSEFVFGTFKGLEIKMDGDDVPKIIGAFGREIEPKGTITSLSFKQSGRRGGFRQGYHLSATVISDLSRLDDFRLRIQHEEFGNRIRQRLGDLVALVKDRQHVYNKHSAYFTLHVQCFDRYGLVADVGDAVYAVGHGNIEYMDAWSINALDVEGNVAGFDFEIGVTTPSMQRMNLLIAKLESIDHVRSVKPVNHAKVDGDKPPAISIRIAA